MKNLPNRIANERLKCIIAEKRLMRDSAFQKVFKTMQGEKLRGHALVQIETERRLKVYLEKKKKRRLSHRYKNL